MRKYLTIATHRSGGNVAFEVFDFDTRAAAEAKACELITQPNEYGLPTLTQVGLNYHWTCPVCDGGPGNFCACRCPKGE